MVGHSTYGLFLNTSPTVSPGGCRLRQGARSVELRQCLLYAFTLKDNGQWKDIHVRFISNKVVGWLVGSNHGSWPLRGGFTDE